jgi:peptidoglycan hydrolase-like protein with peptidoglycan-binding domain
MPDRSTLLLVTCITWLSCAPVHSRSLTPQTLAQLQSTKRVLEIPPISLKPNLTVAQATSPTAQLVLQPGAKGIQVQELQTKLKQLGYYDGEVDQTYGEKTKIAVAKFQKAVGLKVDGIVNPLTASHLQAALAQKSRTTRKKPSSPPPSSLRRWLWLGGGIIITGAAVGGGLFLLLKLLGHSTSTQAPNSELDEELPESENPIDSEGSNPQPQAPKNGYTPTALTLSELSPSDTELKPIADNLAVNSTSRLSKINIVDELIRDLREPDPGKRRKAIWDLAQRGDSRAVQPLVELMIDSDSQQRSLILEALSQIGTRTLKPMNRALAISLQDENAEVRKNAIRDLTRIYELTAQINQLLRHAADDPDAEVQETARWAINQLNRIRSTSGMDNLSSLPNSDNSSSEPPRSP